MNTEFNELLATIIRRRYDLLRDEMRLLLHSEKRITTEVLEKLATRLKQESDYLKKNKNALDTGVYAHLVDKYRYELQNLLNDVLNAYFNEFITLITEESNEN